MTGIFKSIRVRLLLTYLIVILFSITLMGTLFYVMTRDHLLRTKEAYLGSSAEVFLRFIGPFIETEDDLNPAVRFYLRQCWEQLDYQLQVVDSRGRIICDSRGFPGLSGPGDQRLLRSLEGRETTWVEKTAEGQRMNRCVPIRFNGRIIGAAMLSVSLGEFGELFAAMRQYFILTFFLSLFTALATSLIFIRNLMRPITGIRDAAARIARGELDNRLEYDGNDELGDLSRTINNMSEELKKLEKARSEFLGNVSHELKTPLTIIKGFAITLQGSPGIPDDWRNSLETIDRESDRLTRLVNELLELTRLRSGRVTLKLEHVNLRDLVAAVASQMLTRANDAGIEIIVRGPEDLPAASVDADRIREVIINLLDNALKYSASGGRIELEVAVAGDHFEIAVTDNGPGIPQEELPFLFERFFRGRGRKTEGTGLGLAIVREIIGAHGGKIAVSSVPGKETRFLISLPHENVKK